VDYNEAGEPVGWDHPDMYEPLDDFDPDDYDWDYPADDDD
jgi:hypothetical protein